MKTLALAIASYLAAACSILQAGQFVFESPDTLSVRGDFDGDGNLDTLVVEKASGMYRIAYGNGAGSFAFSAPAPSGVTAVSGVAVGRLSESTFDSFALTSPSANQILVISPNPATSTQPEQTYLAGALPRALAALDFKTGNGLDELMATSDLGIGAFPRFTTILRDPPVGGPLVALSSNATSPPITHANPVLLAKGGAEQVGFLTSGVSDNFQLAHINPDGSLGTTTQATVSPDDRFVHGQFDNAKSDFMFYTPGDSPVVSIFRASGFSLGPASKAKLRESIQQLLILDDDATTRVLAIYIDGQAEILDYANGQFSVYASLNLSGPDGTSTSVAPAPGGGFLALFSERGSLSGFQRYGFSGGSYLPSESGAFTPVGMAGTSANFFLYQGDPFLSEATLVRALRSGDWTSNPGAVPAFGLFRFDREQFRGPVIGLGDAMNEVLSVPAGSASFGLANQVRDDASVFAFVPPIGKVVDDVTITPAGGSFGTSVEVSLRSVNPGALIRFRTSPQESFRPYAGPFRIFTDSTVEAFAGSGGQWSPLRTAAFSFSTPAESQDGDGDLVPDFVEEARGLDALAGPDTDGDGYTDLEEILGGSNPADPLDTPAAHLGSTLALDLEVRPRAWDGTANGGSGAAANAAQDTAVEAHDVAGALLGQGLSDPNTASFEVRPVQSAQRILVLSTSSHFEIVTSNANRRIGRELVGLIPAPDPVAPEVPFVFDPGQSLSSQADAWVAAASGPFAAIPPAPLAVELNLDSVLVFALVEHRLQRLLRQRGFSTSTRPLILTPFRLSEDPDLSTYIGPGTLASVEAPLAIPPNPLSNDSVLVRDLLEECEAIVENASADPGVAALKALTREFYQISSVEGSLTPGRLPLPLDALRQFLKSRGTINAEYAPMLSLGAAELSLATQTATILSLSTAKRSILTLTLEASPPGSPPGCTTAQLPGGGQIYSLLSANAEPFEFPSAFQLLPGSEVEVTAFDLERAHCNLPALEVISLSLLSFPVIETPLDQDGNLLPDQWELLFFGNTGQPASESPDGSGYSLLQQYLAGTDPTDPDDAPDEEIVTFALREVNLTPAPNGIDYLLTWKWPEGYEETFGFAVQQSEDLIEFQPQSLSVSHLGNGCYQAVIQAHPGLDEEYFRVAVLLK